MGNQNEAKIQLQMGSQNFDPRIKDQNDKICFCSIHKPEERRPKATQQCLGEIVLIVCYTDLQNQGMILPSCQQTSHRHEKKALILNSY